MFSWRAVAACLGYPIAGRSIAPSLGLAFLGLGLLGCAIAGRWCPIAPSRGFAFLGRASRWCPIAGLLGRLLTGDSCLWRFLLLARDN